MRVWIDANHPSLHVETHLGQPANLEADLELWRTNTHTFSEASPDRGGLFEFGHAMPVNFQADTVFPAQADHLTWCHWNTNSIYPVVFQREHLETLLPKYPDPLLHRCFGATLLGAGLVAGDDHTLKSSTPGKTFLLDLVALTTQWRQNRWRLWKKNLASLTTELQRLKLERAWSAHQKWWRDFWDRSWIHVAGTMDAAKITSGYAMQRWMLACRPRGAQTVKFNGGLFTVGHDVPEGKDSNSKNHNPDFREWGNSFWNQNIRLLYWPLIASGDTDLLQPWFNLYLKALPLAKDRTQLYYHHDGAAFIETMLFWGLPNLNDFGWDSPSNQVQSTWMRYHTQGALEVVVQMLDTYDCTQDSQFARDSIVPFANASVFYHDQHWPRGSRWKNKNVPHAVVGNVPVGCS